MASGVSAGRWTMAVAVVLVGGALLSLAVPRSMAAWAAIGGDDVYSRLADVRPPSGHELELGARAYERAIDWKSSGELMIRLAVIENARAQTMAATAPERAKLLERSERELVAGLSRDPVSGFGWLILASVRQQRDAPQREIARAVIQSLDMSPMTRYLWLPRAQALFLYVAKLDPEELAGVQAHLRIIWNADPSLRQSLLVAFFSSGNLRLLSTSLERDVEAKAELDKLMVSTP